MNNPNKNHTVFLPNLCQANAVLMLILVTELSVLTLVLAATGIIGFSWHHLALTSLFVQWIVLLSALLLCLLRKHLVKPSLWQIILYSYIVTMLITLIVTLITNWLLQGASWNLTEFNVDYSKLLKNLVVSAIITGMVLRYWYIQDNLRKKEQAELHARLQALQSRIRPHFLFNSMNIIASLISTNPAQAEQVVEDLSDLFRASLQEIGGPISLASELELSRRYLAIEQLRLGNRLKVIWQLDECCQTAKIPLLTLQPLLENAIYHGIQPQINGGIVTISIKHQDNNIQIKIINPIPKDHTTQNSAGNNLALQNIKDRLHAMYGDNAGLKTQITNKQFHTFLWLPFRATN